jgi:hypothetical protein
LLYERENKLDNGAIWIAKGAIGCSATDLYTKGLDMVILE